MKGGFEKRSQGRREDREEGNKDRMSDIGLLKTFFCGSSRGFQLGLTSLCQER